MAGDVDALMALYADHAILETPVIVAMIEGEGVSGGKGPDPMLFRRRAT